MASADGMNKIYCCKRSEKVVIVVLIEWNRADVSQPFSHGFIPYVFGESCELCLKIGQKREM